MSKRRISVGFLEPTTFEGDTIYICVRRNPRHWGEEERPVQAVALSLESFRYGKDERDLTTAPTMSYKGSGGKSVYHISTNNLQAKELVDGNYGVFVDVLSRENDGVVVSDTFFEDGISMYDRLEDIRRLAI